uniref:Intraflagellar transport 140 homolog (Chlamydomonas) n=1 Tax=Gouania willdenowi TaxID=441366 RepID=A0A8C5ELC1_GOUWI
MAVYFDHRIEAPDVTNVPTLLAWHSTLPVLAVASSSPASGGNLDLYLQQVNKRPHQPVALRWHPVKPVLAVGWENGEVLLLTHPSGDQTILPSTHAACISLLEWSSSGSRLVTGDQVSNGTLAVWKVDARGRLQGNHLAKHEYNKPLTCGIFRPALPGDDVALLARASVSGDETALDKFNWKGAPLKMGPQEGLVFYVSTADGKVYSVDESCKTSPLLSVEGSVKKLFYLERREALAVITDALMLAQYTLGPEGGAQEFLKVKLSSKPGQNVDIVWTDSSLLLTASGEQFVRLWDLERGDNYSLTLDETLGFEKGEMINCVSFCARKVIAAGTSHGRIAMWRMVVQPGSSSRGDVKAQWKLQTPTEIDGNVTQLQWGSCQNLLAANNSNTVLILSEHVMSADCSQQVAGVQLTPRQISITQFSSGVHATLQSDMHIKGVCVTKNSVTVWNGKQVNVYELSGAVPRNTGSFSCVSHVVAVYEENLFTVEPNRVPIRTPQGTVKQILTFSKAEGNPVLLSVCQSYLVVGTDTAHIQVFDLTRRDAKAHSSAKNLTDQIANLGALRSVKCNANGSQVSILINGRPDQKVYFYDIDMDTVTYFDFFAGRPSSGVSQTEENENGQCPVSHFWDESEPRLFVCETIPVSSESSSNCYLDMVNTQTQLHISTIVDVSVVTLFCTQEHGLLLQDCYPKPSGLQALLAVAVPYYYFTPSASHDEDTPQSLPMVSRRVLRDFVGLENCEKATRDAMLNFSFYLTIGDMDEAFKSIKLIKSKAVWENMARMCVKTRRLDVARVCLGNLGNARAAKALKEAETEPEPETQVAMLAIQLGMLEDAEKLYKSCGRYDLLNNFYQASGKWQQALTVAEDKDRIHLRTTYYNYAKYLESMGDKSLALAYFEKSETHRVEVPRMLQDDPLSLEIYVNKMKDKNIYKWWAQFLESQSELDSALHFYECAQDYLSLVRVHCYMGNIQKGSEIANDTGDRAASYHLARHYEGHDNIKQAVHFYTRAQAYNNAIRLCKENSLDDQLMNLALLSNPEDMMEAACYYEEKGTHMDRAVTLYHKAGYVSKALELAFATEQFSALQLIAEDLNENSDPALLARCSDFFITHSQFEKSVEFLGAVIKGIVSGDTQRTSGEDSRLLHLNMFVFHMQAMRALLNSGDTEKIIFFANVSRQKELFIMAANYLQSLDWHKDPEILKTIISFYTKGRAPELLAGFYEACAQVEIDDYQNYEKALDALTEASKCLSKAKDSSSGKHEARLADLLHKITLVKKFVHIRRYKLSLNVADPDEGLRLCESLLEEPELDPCVRVGDVFGFMIEHHCKHGNFHEAQCKLEEFQRLQPSQNIKYYISTGSLQALQKEIGLPIEPRVSRDIFKEEDEVEEDLNVA